MRYGAHAHERAIVETAHGVPNLELRDKALKLGGVDVIIIIMGSNAH